MSYNAFEFIRDRLNEELEKQGFGEPEPIEDERGVCEMFATEEVAYSLLYEKSRQRFVLRSATLDGEGKPISWRDLSVWLYDDDEGGKSDAESIANDFVDVVIGPKRVALVEQKKKKNKNDERSIDPLFFFNRLANIFPDIKQGINEERIEYGQIRFSTFAKNKVVPECEELIKKYPESETCNKLCEIFDDMYANGDLDLRSIITISILNSLSDEAFAAYQEKFGDELKKASKFSRRLKGKKIRPERKKKEKKKVVARLGDR